MSLSRVVEDVERRAAAPQVAAKHLAATKAALERGWTWTGSKRHAVPARELYRAAVAAMPGAGLAAVYAAVRSAVAQLGGWFVLRGNLRHVRGCRVNHMTDVEAWKASRTLRKPWRRATDEVKG